MTPIQLGTAVSKAPGFKEEIKHNTVNRTTPMDCFRRKEKMMEELLLESYRFMPSKGISPFTVLILQDKIFSEEVAEGLYLLVAQRTDFDDSDIRDYVAKSKEYDFMLVDEKQVLLDHYCDDLRDQSKMNQWLERSITLGMGVILELYRRKGIELTLTDIDLDSLEVILRLRAKHLKPYCLFHIEQL